MDHVKARTALRLEKVMQAAADQDDSRRMAHDVTNPRTENRTKESLRTHLHTHTHTQRERERERERERARENMHPVCST